MGHKTMSRNVVGRIKEGFERAEIRDLIEGENASGSVTQELWNHSSLG